VATGRIGVTPTLRTRWSKQPTAGTTSLSGLDDNSVALVYDVGYEAVYRNGALLSRGNDYTATNGTTVTLIDATLAGDIIEILANQLVPLTNAISNGQFTAKGALLSATAASTPGVLAVGANDTVLTADSTTSTGLKWATPAAGGMTLISTTTISNNATVTIGSIPATYNSLIIFCNSVRPATDGASLQCRITSDSNTRYYISTTSEVLSAFSSTSWKIASDVDNTATEGFLKIELPNYASTTNWKQIKVNASTVYSNGTSLYSLNAWGAYNQTTAISSLDFFASSGNLTAGTILVYGVK
jgi:hypothetical protein